MAIFNSWVKLRLTEHSHTISDGEKDRQVSDGGKRTDRQLISDGEKGRIDR